MNSQHSKNTNPLLSCALTSGFDDTGIVLAAAEKPVLFTIGNAPVINDTDNFSEVSLDRDGNSEIGTGISDAPYYASPLSELDSFNNLQALNDVQLPTIDVNSNTVQSMGVDGSTNANPLAAFGTAASTVFSTFSSIIKGSTSQTRIDEQQHHTNDVGHDNQQQDMFNVPQSFGYSAPADTNAPPPSFFSPDDDKLFKKTEIEPPSNSFRLGGSKKKAYAHIPGLSSSSTQSQAVPQNFNLNPVMPPLPPQPITHVDSMANFQPPPPINFNSNTYDAHDAQESTLEKSKFSFSSLLDKIPVTKNLFGITDPTPVEQTNYQEFDQIPMLQQPPQEVVTNSLAPTPSASNPLAAVKNNFFNLYSPETSDNLTSTLSSNQTNFFNPQQFNTNPFAKAQQQQQPFTADITLKQQEPEQQVITTPPSSFSDYVQPSPSNFTFAPPNFSTPPLQQNDTVNSQNLNEQFAPPPVFFNPNEASEMFKQQRQNDDGKPKNPYSNVRPRGVGLYRTRTTSSSDSTNVQQQIFVPQTSNSTNLQTSSFFTPAPFQEPSIGVNSTASIEPPITPFTVTPTSQERQQSITPPQKKSDLNIPETVGDINVELHGKEQKKAVEVAPLQNVSNFFSYSNNNNHNNNNINNHKVYEQESAINFFQVQPEISQQQPVISQITASSNNSVNFFSMDQVKNEIDSMNQKNEELNDFNSPIINSTMQTNETLNDATDKLESLSAYSRSTLSLFATSELDSTMNNSNKLSSVPVESLIPKFFETQPSAPAVENLNEGIKYRPIYCHWFYQNLYWHPFSMSDSIAIDNAIQNSDEVVYTSGGRYLINVKDRRRSSIYWSSGSNVVRKCSWFYIDAMAGSRNLIPYEENLAEFFEKEYEKAVKNESWNQSIALPNSDDTIIFRDFKTIEHHQMGHILTVKRGVDEFDIDDGEEGNADHLILCISHFGDKIDENADEVRSKCLETIQQYYTEAFDCGQIKKIEVLPIALNSIDVLQMFEVNNEIINSSSFKNTSREINGHIMRTMLYSNETFYQKIMNHLAFSLNEIVSKFKQQNQNFSGEISLMSSSYEALFIFDLLANQNVSEFWKIQFDISRFFACGMPTSLLMIRNGDKLKHGFKLSNCKKMFNILHPYDAVGQRIEPLIMPEYSSTQAELIENLSSNSKRIDFSLPDDATIETFTTAKYFSSEILIKRITNEIYGNIEMDSGSL